jgi:phage baseplate assembly protein gpV
MRKSRRRLVIPLVVFALVAAAGIAGGLSLVAHAQNAVTFCNSSTTAPITCTTDTETITSPSAIDALVILETSDGATTADQDIVVTWQGDCSQGSNDTDIAASTATPEPITTAADVTVNIPLPYTDPDDCDITVTGTLQTTGGSTDTTGAFELELQYTPQSSSSSSSSSTTSSVDVPYIGGFGGKCIDDRGNSSSNGTELIIWGCNHGDSAQDWTWNSSGELEHDGMCANDPGYGGSGSKLILWSCTGTSNERWSHVTFGRFKLNYSGKGALCLDDPGFSTSNGTRLMVYKCNGGSNQNWSRST